MSKIAHTVAFSVLGKVGDIVYQRVGKGRGNIETPGRHDLQVRALGDWTDRRSVRQLQCRARIAAATAAYQALSEEERASWREQAKGKRATGYNLFVADFCARHHLSEF